MCRRSGEASVADPFDAWKRSAHHAEYARESEKVDEVLLALARSVPGFELTDQGFGRAEHAMRRDDGDPDRIKDQMGQRPGCTVRAASGR